MLKKTLIATAAISVTLLAAAAVLPALAQSRGTASANAAAPSAPVDAASQEKLSADNDTGTRKAEGSGRDTRHGDEGRGSSDRKDKEEEKHKSRD